MIQPKTRTKAIRSGSAKNKLAATAIVRAQKQGVLKKAAHPKAKAAASGGKENNLPTFRIGKFLTLGRSLNPKAVASGQCFRKGRDTDWYCLEHANWPQKMARAMGVSAWHYRKEATVVQYKYGKAVRIYSVIPSKTYEDAVEYYSNLIGPPTKVLSDKLARLGNTPLSNPSSFWVNASNKGSTETLEIRKFDNIRGLMAYETMGLVRLFKENSDPIFAILSDTDLILHQIRANNRK